MRRDSTSDLNSISTKPNVKKKKIVKLFIFKKNGKSSKKEK